MSSRWLQFAIGAASCASVSIAGVNSFTLTGPEGGYVHAMAVQPGHPEVVIASTSHGLYRSTDAGASWTNLDTRSLGTPTVLAFAPGAPDRVYGGALRLMVSTDAGQTFANTGTPNPARELLAVAGNRVYTASYAGDILRSDDGMQNWTTLAVPWPTGGTAGVLYSIAVDPSNADVLYACAIGRGLYKTINGGNTWITPPAGSPCSRPNEYTYQFAVSPGDPNRVLVPTSEGFFVSTNGGASWSDLGVLGRVPWVSFDPAAPANVITMQYDGPIMRSSDGGMNWQWGANNPALKLDQRIPPAWTGVAGHFYLPRPMDRFSLTTTATRSRCAWRACMPRACRKSSPPTMGLSTQRSRWAVRASIAVPPLAGFRATPKACWRANSIHSRSTTWPSHRETPRASTWPT